MWVANSYFYNPLHNGVSPYYMYTRRLPQVPAVIFKALLREGSRTYRCAGSVCQQSVIRLAYPVGQPSGTCNTNMRDQGNELVVLQ